MGITRISNYEIMKKQMSGEFVKYDQEKMIRKFSLPADGDFIYIRFVGRDYRIDRKTGAVEWSEDGFATAAEADYNEAMTIYDVLCYSKDTCVLSGNFCPVNSLKGVVQSSKIGDGLYQAAADLFAGKTEQLEAACAKLGEKTEFKGDVAAKIHVFGFLPIILQFWDADEEFSAVLKFMVDENMIGFMHYETIHFMLGHVLRRLKECME